MAPKQPVAGPSRPKNTPTPATAAPPPPPSSGAFNPSSTLFALALPVLGSADKLTVWDVASDTVVSEWEVDGASKVATVCWTTIPAVSGGKKKRRKQDGDAESVKREEAIIVTTERGVVFVYHPTKGVVGKWDLPVKATSAWADDRGVFLSTATAVILLASDAASIKHTFELPPNTPTPTALAALPGKGDKVTLVLSSDSVFQLEVNTTTGKVLSASSPLPVATSTVTSLVPLPRSSHGSSFLVIAANDRTVSQYTVAPNTQNPRLSYRYASPTVSPAHSASISSSHVSVLHSSGEVSLFPLPSTIDLSRPGTDSKPSFVKLVEGKTDRQARVCQTAFATDEGMPPMSLFCGRMTGGGRVKWHRATFASPLGEVKPETVIKCEAADLHADQDASKTTLQRFAAPATSGTVAEPETGDESSSALPADVDMADLSLGERLLAVPDGVPAATATPHKSRSKEETVIPDGPLNTASLTRLLNQALHTSDPALLTVCLSTRDPVLIRNTIRKLPSSMALPLLKACVERLGQGKGAHKRGGGRGSGQSEQAGRGTVEWVKGVLVERGAILMSMPSLPLHLATLSQLLNTRLQLYQPLLSLSGRLDLAMAQITMRRIAAEQQAKMQVDGVEGGEGVRYAEGESDDEDEVPIEYGHDGEIDDIDMMANGFDSDDVDEDVTSDEDEAGSDEDEVDDESDDPLESDVEGGALSEADDDEDEEEEGDSDDE